jgi:hypothetical protein
MIAKETKLWTPNLVWIGSYNQWWSDINYQLLNIPAGPGTYNWYLRQIENWEKAGITWSTFQTDTGIRLGPDWEGPCYQSGYQV